MREGGREVREGEGGREGGREGGDGDRGREGGRERWREGEKQRRKRERRENKSQSDTTPHFLIKTHQVQQSVNKHQYRLD